MLTSGQGNRESYLTMYVRKRRSFFAVLVALGRHALDWSNLGGSVSQVVRCRRPALHRATGTTRHVIRSTGWTANCGGVRAGTWVAWDRRSFKYLADRCRRGRYYRNQRRKGWNVSFFMERVREVGWATIHPMIVGGRWIARLPRWSAWGRKGARRRVVMEPGSARSRCVIHGEVETACGDRIFLRKRTAN
jgi:hypothetical protein